ncbi:MAG: hypothetical protein Kow0010_01730 [Dehalococcoidia bacterium]
MASLPGLAGVAATGLVAFVTGVSGAHLVMALLAGVVTVAAIGAVVTAARAPAASESIAASLASEVAHDRELIRLQAAALDSAANAVFITDTSGRIQWVNPAFTQMTGYAAEEVRGQTPRILKSGRQDSAYYQKLWREILAGHVFRSVMVNRRKDGSLYTAEQTVTPIVTGGKVTHFVAIQDDVTTEMAAKERIHRLAHFDDLTGLPNRTSLRMQLQSAIERAEARGRMVGLLFFDLDELKDINDALGHEAGDELLRETGRRLANAVEPFGIAFRLSGDEFTVLLPNVQDEKEPLVIAERILETLRAKPFLVGTRSVRITGSIGVALYPRDAWDSASLMRAADSAMYVAKQEGRDKVQEFSSDASEAKRWKTALIQSLAGAAARGELRLDYQPIARMRDDQIVGVEALVRWDHPEFGELSPTVFVPLAETSDLIDEIGEWVLVTATRQLREWDRQGVKLRVSVNVSPRQLRRPGFARFVAQILTRSGISPERLELEVTERSLVEEADETIGTLRDLRQIGVGLAVDDFGIGYSGLSYFKRLPVTAVKLDRSFVFDLMDNATDQLIIETIIGLGHALGLRIIAEGVECEEHAEFLRARGCDEYQGYLLSQPLPARSIADLLSARAA